MTRHRDRGGSPAPAPSPPRQECGRILVVVYLSLAAVACAHARTAAPRASAATVDDGLDDAIATASDVERGLPPSIVRLTRCVAVLRATDRDGAAQPAPRQGFVACRTGTSWSRPAPISLAGESAQAQRTPGELILLVMTEPALEKLLLRARLRLGTDVSSAAGIVGTAETGAGSHAEVLSYGRSGGVLSGVDAGDVTIEQNQVATVGLYGGPMDFRTLLLGAK